MNRRIANEKNKPQIWSTHQSLMREQSWPMCRATITLSKEPNRLTMINLPNLKLPINHTTTIITMWLNRSTLEKQKKETKNKSISTFETPANQIQRIYMKRSVWFWFSHFPLRYCLLSVAEYCLVLHCLRRRCALEKKGITFIARAEL